MRPMLLLLMLAGCSGAPRPCPPSVQVQTVEKPVPVACLHASDIQPEPGPTTLYPEDAARSADALAATDSALRVWGRSLVAMMQPCMK